MRNAFFQTLIDVADRDERVVVLTGDLGFGVLEDFAERFPKRFVNVGVAEQNMVGVATGLADSGYIPFVYSVASFATLRPYEFIRNGPVFHDLPVRVVGIGGGIEYEFLSRTHFSVEDLGVMRLQPNLAVIAPAEGPQASGALLATWDRPGPVYYRLGRREQLRVPGLDGRFAMDRVETVRDGDDLVLVTTGGIAAEVVAAAEALAARGIEAAVVVAAALNPPPAASLVEAIQHAPLVVTVETHYVVGGVGSLVAEVIADHGLGTALLRLGIAKPLSEKCGKEPYLQELYDISRDSIVDAVVARARTPAVSRTDA